MRRERVLSTIEHKSTTPIPYNVELTSEKLAEVSDYIGIDKTGFFKWAGNHIEKCSCNIGGKYIKPGFFKDEFGVIWNRSGLDKDIGISDIQIKNPDLSEYTFPEPDVAEICNNINKFLHSGNDTFKMGKIGFTLYERAWSLVGMENLLMDFILEPSFVDELFENILEYNLKIIDAVMEYSIDGFYFGDDYGQQTGMIMSPETWRKFIKPGLSKMFEKIKKRGKVVALHSCGNISDILGDLIDIGLDIYQTVQPEIYDLKKLKREYGNNLSFWGGISTQQLLPYAKPDEIKSTVKEIISIMSDNGGYIASPTHQVPADVPPENIVALIEVLKEC